MFSKNVRNGFFKAACLGTALLVAAPTFANVTRVSELVDVDPNVWAYKALKELVEKYDVLEGYPSKTFMGNKSATRYELAQALYEVLKVMDVMDSGSIDGADMEKIGRLKRQFDRELSDIRNKVASLEGRVSALEASTMGGSSAAISSWTDRIKVSGDLTNQLRQDFDTRGGGANTDTLNWGTRARLGVDAVLIGQDPSSDILGEGIAHIRFNASNGGGTYGYATAGNNLDDIMVDASNATGGGNNSFVSGAAGDSRMDVYLDQAYYTQVFKFQKSDPCTNEVKEYPNFFAVVDLGQQDLWNTFHKSLVREDSLDGFTNKRILHGVVGASDSVTEAVHIGLNWLGDEVEGERVDSCGNPISAGVDGCGNPLPGFFQAFSLDYAFAAHKGANSANIALNAPTTNRAADNQSHNLAANLLYDLPGELLGTGLLTAGASVAHLDWNNSAGVNTLGDDWGWTFFTKMEQYFGVNRTFGIFFDYTWASHDSTNTYLQGPVANLIQMGAILNTTFLSDTWNFNKDQIGLAYSLMDPHNGNVIAGTNISALPSAATGGAAAFQGGNQRAEHIVEAYYRKYVTENISVTPDLVVNFAPNGSNNPAFSVGLRSTFKLPNWNDGGAFDQFGYRDWSQRIAKYKAANSAL